MIVALVDNGSLEPAAHRTLRGVATALSTRTGINVHPVSWKHSDRIREPEPGQVHAWTMAPFLRAMVALGQREFVFIPYFISPQGAIGSALFRDLEKLQRELGDFDFTFTDGLAARGVLPAIVADRVRSCIKANELITPPLIVVDHGGPSAESAALRDTLGAQIGGVLKDETARVAVTSMEGEHPPLLSDALRDEAFARGDVVVAPLFLSPGRHAGPNGDLARICRAAAAPRTHLTDLVGTHPLVVDSFADALRTTLSTLHAHSFA